MLIWMGIASMSCLVQSLKKRFLKSNWMHRCKNSCRWDQELSNLFLDSSNSKTLFPQSFQKLAWIRLMFWNWASEINWIRLFLWQIWALLALRIRWLLTRTGWWGILRWTSMSKVPRRWQKNVWWKRRSQPRPKMLLWKIYKVKAKKKSNVQNLRPSLRMSQIRGMVCWTSFRKRKSWQNRKWEQRSRMKSPSCFIRLPGKPTWNRRCR